MPRKKQAREVSVGTSHAALPGLAPVMWGAVDISNMARSRNRINVGPFWVLVYTFHPTLVRVGHCSRRWYRCDAGTGVMIPPYTTYWTDDRRSREAGRHCWITIHSLESSPLYAMLQNGTGFLRFRDPSGSLGRLMEALVQAGLQSKDQPFWPLQYHLQPVLRCLERAAGAMEGVYEISDRASGSSLSLIVPVVDYLQKNLASRVTITGIARHLGLSVSSISHAYRQQTGETTMQTLRRMRIHQVKALLMHGLSLDAIAAAAGFYDAHHVSREFRRHEGMTASAFLGAVRTPGYGRTS